MNAKKIKDVREAKGISGKELAETVGVTPSAITYYEQGLRNPTLETLGRIADALGVDHSDLISKD